MLNEYDGEPLLPQLEDQRAKSLDLARDEPRSRLIHEKRARRGGERAGDLQQTTMPIGEGRARKVRVSGEPDQGEQFVRDRLAPRLLAPAARGVEQSVEHTGASAKLGADHHMLAGRHVTEEADVLEGPHDPTLRGVVKRMEIGPPAVDRDVAVVRPVIAREDIDEGCLAGSIRANESVHLAGLDGERDVSERPHAAEGLGESGDREDWALGDRGEGRSSAAAPRAGPR